MILSNVMDNLSMNLVVHNSVKMLVILLMDLSLMLETMVNGAYARLVILTNKVNVLKMILVEYYVLVNLSLISKRKFVKINVKVPIS